MPNSNNMGAFGGGGVGGMLGAQRWRAGGESGRPGAWQTTLQIPISPAPGFLLGQLCLAEV
eukprot:1160610-Pelagomonas_calceolata.AAC.19